jgi:hypothetical protein
MTALQGWVVIGLLVLIVLGIVGLGAEIKPPCRTYGVPTRRAPPWRDDAGAAQETANGRQENLVPAQAMPHPMRRTPGAMGRAKPQH